MTPQDLLARNAAWARAKRDSDPLFFKRLTEQQSPRYFWIGCSDSRVPATQITDLDPGEIFVHRNVANLANHTDMNFLCALQFAVEVLKVEHVIVCGHYGCGGVRAALSVKSYGLLDNWLRSLRDLRERQAAELTRAIDRDDKEDLMVELNVAAQVDNISRNPIVQAAWHRGQSIAVHGWVYRLRDGILHDLGHRITDRDSVDAAHKLEPS